MAEVQKGDHVTVGKSKNVWLISYPAYYSWGGEDYSKVVRVSPDGKYQSKTFENGRLTIIGKHAARDMASERPQNCAQCGCFREVKK